MVSDAQVRELVIKQSRRILLETLKLFYPATVEFRTLRLTLPTIEERYLRVDVSYLIDKGYVVWLNELPNANWGEREFKLTAQGVEAADRIIKDPALES